MQCAAVLGSATVVAWAILATATLVTGGVVSGRVADGALTRQALYETRLNTLSQERDAALANAVSAQDRFSLALAEVSDMQTRLLEAEARADELEAGLAAVQARLAEAVTAREMAKERLLALTAPEADTADDAALPETLAFLTDALEDTAEERDAMRDVVADAAAEMQAFELDRQLTAERHDRLFQQIEEAVTASLGPLDEMFAATGLPTEDILENVRRSYSGTGGLHGDIGDGTITTSTRSAPADAESLRAAELLRRLDELAVYRIAAAQTPFAIPVDGSYRFTSGFGRRWGRMHKGADFAGAHGTPILATAEGEVVFAGRQSGYGNIVKIRHTHGIETRYAHMSKIHVSVGDRVSRGDRIGDMGNTGRSTGTHLHYEVRIDGEAVNPMTYIKAARDVF